MTRPEDGWHDLGPGRVAGSAEDYREAHEAKGLLGPALRMLTESLPLMDEWLRQHPLKPMTRRQRWAFRVRSARERVALRVAPWLDHEDDL